MSFFGKNKGKHAIHGKHYSGYYVKQSKKTGKHGNGTVIIDVDPVIYYESIEDAKNKKNSYESYLEIHGLKDNKAGNNISYLSETVYGIHVNNSLLARCSRFIRYDMPIWAICIMIGAGIPFSSLLFIGLFNIPSASMEPTLMTGDRVIASRLWLHDNNVHRGDIIVFKDPGGWLEGSKAGQDLCKRVIGIPGDTVSTDENGNILVNNRKIDEPYLREGMKGSDIPFSVKVTDGHVFVMGDNRTNSADSRYHVNDENNGLVPINDITNIVNIRFWPLNKIDFNMSDNVSK